VSDHIELYGKKYYEESYLVLSNNNTHRSRERVKEQAALLSEAVGILVEVSKEARTSGGDGGMVPFTGPMDCPVCNGSGFEPVSDSNNV